MPDQGNEGVLALIIESHRRIVGRPLVDERLDAAAQLREARELYFRKS